MNYREAAEHEAAGIALQIKARRQASLISEAQSRASMTRLSRGLEIVMDMNEVIKDIGYGGMVIRGYRVFPAVEMNGCNCRDSQWAATRLMFEGLPFYAKGCKHVFAGIVHVRAERSSNQERPVALTREQIEAEIDALWGERESA